MALAVCVPRLNGGHWAGDYLWAEDGNLFIEQARTLGWRSLWTPYAGYLHLYPRLFAFVACHFDLQQASRILLSGWLIAYLALASVIIRRCLAWGLHPACALLYVGVIFFQPSNGEVFFNITNSQWHAGAALTLFVLTSDNQRISTAGYLLLLVAGLTGPFSVLLMPLLLLHAALFRSQRRPVALYLTVAACGALQACVLMGADRLQSNGVNADPAVWFSALRSMALFGADSIRTSVAAVTFWVLLGALFFRARDGRKTALLLLLAALIQLAAALYASRADPRLTVFFGSGNRYTWIPYCLIFVAALRLAVAVQRAWALLLLLLPLILLDHAGFRPIQFGRLNFGSFYNFSQYVPVVVPINPVVPTYPGWYINGGPPSPALMAPQQSTLQLDHSTVAGAAARMQSGVLTVDAPGTDPAVYFKDRIDCGAARDIGLEVELERDQDGWVQLFWAAGEAYSEAASLRRFYPAGAVTAQFAFRNGQHPLSVRVDPLEHPGRARIRKVKFYCLP
jgi:hypothetical protein